MYLFLLLIVLLSTRCQILQNNNYSKFIQSDENTDLKLSRLEPVSVGHEQELHLESGRTLIIKTVAVRPPLFEIENFLTSDECEKIKLIAKKGAWEKSATLPKTAFRKGAKEGSHKINFTTADVNYDGYINFRELWHKRPPIQNSMITLDDIKEFIQFYKYDTDGDEKLNSGEFGKIDIKLMYEWMYEKIRTDKRKQHRTSDQVWMEHKSHEVFGELQKRVVLLTGLSKQIVDNNGEAMQIVHYDVGGHYHAHYDSERVDNAKKCGHTGGLLDGAARLDFKNYRVCRYLTVMYYLNDVDDGGETAFPIADNVTYKGNLINEEIYDLSNHCKDANVVVKPKKGKAVMWYNHVLNEDGWIGENDVYSLHGGCDIKQGVKWIANHWIHVDTDKERQTQYLKKLRNNIGNL
ncbi:transmembrane prolyl 4-hydroxylase-like [Antedon mediterranea]|uniref:transmembrane prolyl 4-hydroxylase-like n=1 Tax=Antedon mediterranea TaxID=105859 RepID=UPI003AF55187